MRKIYSSYPDAIASFHQHIQDLRLEVCCLWWVRRALDGVTWIETDRTFKGPVLDLRLPNPEPGQEKDWSYRIEVMKADAYGYLRDALEHGQPIVVARPQRDEEEDKLVIDWLNALPEINPRLLPKLHKVTWAQAVINARAWHEHLAKNKLIGVAGDKGTSRVCKALDGWYWVKLTTTGALDREGKVMGHCVGNGGYDNLLETKSVYAGIYSLRDADGRSHVTVEVYETIGMAWIQQVQGPGNTMPTSEMTRHFGALDNELASVTGLAHWPAGYLRDLRSYDIYHTEDLPAGAVLENLETSIQHLHKLPEALSINGNMLVRRNYFFAPQLDQVRFPRGLIVRGDFRCPEELLPLPDDVLVCGKVIPIEKVEKQITGAIGELWSGFQRAS